MKKSFFLSILAVGALVACSKSEVVDTKYGNDEISFQTYTGRNAQTKASEITTANVGSIAVYGYYTGANPWAGSMTANLWNPLTLTVAEDGKGSVPEGQEKYWTNDTDLYTFLAYAPINETKLPATVDATNGPTISYTVSETIKDQIDVLYATPQIDRTKGNGVVAFTMNHALSRITVKAKDADATDPFTFDVKEVSISGNFYNSGKIVLGEKDPEWSNLTTENTSYLVYRNGTEAEDGTVTYTKYSTTTALTADNVDYAGTAKDNYLMVIPTTEDAVLTVKYTTYYMNAESKVITKTLPITTDFVEGQAYSINLEFDDSATEITFTVTVTPWSEETPISGGNPEAGEGWTIVK